MSRRSESALWHDKLESLRERCKSRIENVNRTRSFLAEPLSVSNFETAPTDSLTLEPRALETHDEQRREWPVSDWRMRSLFSSSQIFEKEENSREELEDAIPGNARQPVPPLQMGALASSRRIYRPQSARISSDKENVREQKQRPSTARASGDKMLSAQGQRRTTWRPFFAKSAKSRPLSSRSSRPLSARSLGAFSEAGSYTRATTPAVATWQFRESVRPLLANVMRQGSENQHPSAIKPVSACGLTPTGTFRF